MAASAPGTILVVDDEPAIRTFLQRLLAGQGHEVITARDSAEAMALIPTVRPDLVLLDVMLPGMDGPTLCRRLREDAAVIGEIPVVLMTAAAEIDGLLRSAGADAIVRKPFRRDELLSWAHSLMLTRRARKSLEHAEAMLVYMAAMIEARSLHTEAHLRRVADLSARLAAAAGLPDATTDIVRKAALLHDVGQIGVPEAILQKPGPLTPDEFEQVKRHTTLGADLCRVLPCGEEMGAFVRAHHERWDGEGYPDGLAGEAIPLGARIIAVADAFDACTTDRPYRSAFSPSDGLDILWFGAGAQWDSHLVELFDPMVRSSLQITAVAVPGA